MTNDRKPMGAQARNNDRRGWLIVAANFTIVALIFGLNPGLVDFAAWSRINLHADFAPLAAASLLVQVHVVTVAIAVVGGPVQFALPKGTPAHRVVGWIWVGAMLITAVATLFIRELNHGAFSIIHVFSVMTLIGTPIAVWQAKRGNIAAHTRAMVGLYIGLIIAGVTAAAPGRLLWDMFFG